MAAFCYLPIVLKVIHVLSWPHFSFLWLPKRIFRPVPSHDGKAGGEVHLIIIINMARDPGWG
jgi:hypothetical protein